jgi:hypothetical protein
MNFFIVFGFFLSGQILLWFFKTLCVSFIALNFYFF